MNKISILGLISFVAFVLAMAIGAWIKIDTNIMMLLAVGTICTKIDLSKEV